MNAMQDYISEIRRYIELEKAVLDSLEARQINCVMNILEDVRRAKGRIFICGNGGSASTASHFGCDFNKGIELARGVKYDVECLCDNVPMMMAVANDIGYEEIFVEPLKNKLKPGDLVIGISGSGNSGNVIKALEYAKKEGARTVAIVGYDGGQLKEAAENCIHVNVNHMQIVEDIHLVLNHMMMFILSQREKYPERNVD